MNVTIRFGVVGKSLALLALASLPACGATSSSPQGDAALAQDGGHTGVDTGIDAAAHDTGVAPHDGAVDAADDTGAPDGGSDAGTDACRVDVDILCAGRCGTVLDPTCAVNINCGDRCTAPATCGGEGQPTFCGCTSDPVATTCALGRCGQVLDNCGRTVDCGNPCTGRDTCGGGDAPGYCGCTPEADPCGAVVCGTTVDQCGNVVTCGVCRRGTTCCETSCMPVCP